MKTIVGLFTLIVIVACNAATTNELVYSDIATRQYQSDYGALILSVSDIVSAPKWDEQSEPPISVSNAINSVRQILPPLKDAEWIMESITLNNFDGKGWHYLVVHSNHTAHDQDDRHYLVSKQHIAVVLMNGRVIYPQNDEHRSVEQGAGVVREPRSGTRAPQP